MAEPGGLAAAWDDCRTIRSRFRKQWPWLQWPYYVSHDDGKDNEESSTPKHPACTKALELNAEALLCMLDSYGCTFAEIPQLQDEVKELYRLEKYDSKTITNDSYTDAWDLRRLYTYSWRRQWDAQKRNQIPRDKRVQELFAKIAEYRAAGTSLPQDASMEAERNDEDDTLYVAGSPKDAVVQASPSDSTKTTPASTEKVPKVQEEFYLMEVSEEQEKELSALLAEIDALENTQKSSGSSSAAVSPQSLPAPSPALPVSTKPVPQPPLQDPTQLDTMPMEDPIYTPSPLPPKPPAEQTPDKVEPQHEIAETVEPAPIKVSPASQNEMRSAARKTMTRGRKSKTKGKKAGNKSIKRKKSKREILKTSKGSKVESKQHAQEKGKPKKTRDDPENKLPKSKTDPQQNKTKRKGKLAEPDSSAPAESTRTHVKVSQSKVEDTKGRIVYEVLPNQTFGCCCCRWIFNGCKICRNPNFKGKSVAARRAEQEQAEQDWDEQDWDGQEWDEQEWEEGGAGETATEQEAAGTKPAKKSKKKRKATA